MKTYGGKHGTANIEARQPIDREINKIYMYRKPNSNTWIFSLFFVFFIPITFVYLQTIPTSTPPEKRGKTERKKINLCSLSFLLKIKSTTSQGFVNTPHKNQ
jgi:hypothetical protein